MGATAIDEEDGDLTAMIVVTGYVDTSVPGDYIVSYDVSDSHGNTATTRKRVVRVLALGLDVPSIEIPATEGPDAEILGSPEHDGASDDKIPLEALPPPPPSPPRSPLLSSFSGQDVGSPEEVDSNVLVGLVVAASVLAGGAAVGGIAYALRRLGGSATTMMPAQFPSMPERVDLAKEQLAATRVMRMKSEV